MLIIRFAIAIVPQTKRVTGYLRNRNDDFVLFPEEFVISRRKWGEIIK